MRTSRSFRVYFTITSENARDVRASIYTALMVNKEKFFIALKASASVAVWNFGKGAAKGIRDEARQINAYLEDVRLVLGNCYKELLLNGDVVTSKAIKSMFLG